MASFDIEIYYRDGRIRAESLPDITSFGENLVGQWMFHFDSIEEGIILQFTHHYPLRPDEHALDVEQDPRGLPTMPSGDFFAQIVEPWEIPDIIRIDYFGTTVFREIGGYLVNLNKVRNLIYLYMADEYQNGLLYTIAQLAEILSKQPKMLEEHIGFDSPAEGNGKVESDLAHTLGVPVDVLKQAQEYRAAVDAESEEAIYEGEGESAASEGRVFLPEPLGVPAAVWQAEPPANAPMAEEEEDPEDGVE